MTTATLAEFSRMHGASKTAVTKWKRRGYLVFSNGMVDVEKSDAKLAACRKGRFGESAGRSTKSTCNAKSSTAQSTSHLVDATLSRITAPDEAIREATTIDTAIAALPEFLLPLLPVTTVKSICFTLTARLRAGAIECLVVDEIEIPEGLRRWEDWDGFSRPVLSELEWQELIAEFGGR